MNEVKLGKLIDGTPQRDAVHFAVVPMQADERLSPGQHVGITKGMRASSDEALIGIVDPFLIAAVMPGDLFWLVLYPDTVTGMRHHWAHPAFDELTGPKPTESVRWLQWFAGEVGIDYDEMMDAAENYQRGGEYWIFQGRDTPYVVYENDNHITFWKHYQNVTGKPVEDGDSSFFSCSC